MSGIAKKLDPILWEQAKRQACIEAKLCAHSARKMQWATRRYKKLGGRYEGPKSKKNLLSQWTKQDWRTFTGMKSEGKRRYLPAKAWDVLTTTERKATDRAKRLGTKKGKQVVRQPKKIAAKTRRFRKIKK
jgi:hypothetical protein